MAVFSLAGDGVRAAVDIQTAVGANEWSVEEGFALRVGLHTGVADERDGDFFGTEVNRAARLMSAAHGHQLLVSGATAGLVAGEIDGLTDLGEHRLKDLSRHERVWQVPVPNGPTSFPALNTVDGRRGNLPAPTTSFVGREAELDEFEALLAGCRLLTLVGAGGSGKTRLALELAARVSDQFEGGVWVVDLWQIDDPGQIEDAVIATLGLQYGQDRDGRQVLVGALDYSPVLVVLDTCEHLVEAVADLADFLIGRCPELTVIATSREVLPTSSALARPVEALGEGVELFAARAGATRNGFTLTDSNRDAVDRICRQLDGIPLAIELVAARTATLDLAAIESRLHDVFRFVRGLARGQSERHSTLETTIGWSYELLEPAEQALFDRLSVFLGGFTLEAAERVCSDPEQIDELDVVDLLERLVDKSMVTTIDDDWIGRRYRLLDTTRAFGQARLAAENQTDTWLERHSRFYADWTRRVSSTAYGPEAGRVRREIVAEIPNLRSATEWPTRRTSPRWRASSG